MVQRAFMEWSRRWAQVRRHCRTSTLECWTPSYRTGQPASWGISGGSGWRVCLASGRVRTLDSRLHVDIVANWPSWHGGRTSGNSRTVITKLVHQHGVTGDCERISSRGVRVKVRTTSPELQPFRGASRKGRAMIGIALGGGGTCGDFEVGALLYLYEQGIRPERHLRHIGRGHRRRQTGRRRGWSKSGIAGAEIAVAGHAPERGHVRPRHLAPVDRSRVARHPARRRRSRHCPADPDAVHGRSCRLGRPGGGGVGRQPGGLVHRRSACEADRAWRQHRGGSPGASRNEGDLQPRAHPGKTRDRARSGPGGTLEPRRPQPAQTPPHLDRISGHGPAPVHHGDRRNARARQSHAGPVESPAPGVYRHREPGVVAAGADRFARRGAVGPHPGHPPAEPDSRGRTPCGAGPVGGATERPRDLPGHHPATTGNHRPQDRGDCVGIDAGCVPFSDHCGRLVHRRRRARVGADPGGARSRGRYGLCGCGVPGRPGAVRPIPDGHLGRRDIR